MNRSQIAAVISIALASVACEPGTLIRVSPPSENGIPLSMDPLPGELTLGTLDPLIIQPVIHADNPNLVSISVRLRPGPEMTQEELNSKILPALLIETRPLSKAVFIRQTRITTLDVRQKKFIASISLTDGLTTVIHDITITHTLIRNSGSSNRRSTPQWPQESLTLQAYSGLTHFFEDINVYDPDFHFGGMSVEIQGDQGMNIENLSALQDPTRTSNVIQTSFAASNIESGQQRHFVLTLVELGTPELRSLPLYLTIQIRPEMKFLVDSNGGFPIDAGEGVHNDLLNQVLSAKRLDNGDILVTFPSGSDLTTESGRPAVPVIQAATRYRSSTGEWQVLSENNGWTQNEIPRDLLRTDLLVTRGGGVFTNTGDFYGIWSTVAHQNGSMFDDHGLFRLGRISHFQNPSSSEDGYFSYYNPYAQGFQREHTYHQVSSWNASSISNSQNPLIVNRSETELLSVLQRADFTPGSGPTPSQFSLIGLRVKLNPQSPNTELLEYWDTSNNSWAAASPTIANSKIVSDSEGYNEFPEVLQGPENDILIPFLQCSARCNQTSASITRNFFLIRYNGMFERLTPAGWTDSQTNFLKLNSKNMWSPTNDQYAVTTSAGDLHMIYLATERKFHHVYLASHSDQPVDTEIDTDVSTSPTFTPDQIDFRIALFPDTQIPFIVWKSRPSGRYLSGLKLVGPTWVPLKGEFPEFHYIATRDPSTLDAFAVFGGPHETLQILLTRDHSLFALMSPELTAREIPHQPLSPRANHSLASLDSTTWAPSSGSLRFPASAYFSVASDGFMAVANATGTQLSLFPDFSSAPVFQTTFNWDAFSFPTAVELDDTHSRAFFPVETMVGAQFFKIRLIDTTGNSVDFPNAQPNTGTAELTHASGIPFSGVQNISYDSARSLLWISDSLNNRIVRTGVNGTQFTQADSWGTAGTGPGMIERPRGICQVGAFVYIVDSQNHRIQKFSETGDFQNWAIGSYGSGPGQFIYPNGIACNSEFMVVHDAYNSRVQMFSLLPGSEGELLSIVNTGSTLEDDEHLTSIKSFDLAEDGSLYFSGRIQEVDPTQSSWRILKYTRRAL